MPFERHRRRGCGGTAAGVRLRAAQAAGLAFQFPYRFTHSAQRFLALASGDHLVAAKGFHGCAKPGDCRFHREPGTLLRQPFVAVGLANDGRFPAIAEIPLYHAADASLVAIEFDLRDACSDSAGVGRSLAGMAAAFAGAFDLFACGFRLFQAPFANGLCPLDLHHGAFDDALHLFLAQFHFLFDLLAHRLDLGFGHRRAVAAPALADDVALSGLLVHVHGDVFGIRVHAFDGRRSRRLRRSGRERYLRRLRSGGRFGSLRRFGLRIGDGGGERQRQRSSGDGGNAKPAPAAGNFGHGEAPQTVNDRFLAKHRASHGGRQSQMVPGRETGNHTGIGCSFWLRTASHDARIARRLLIPAHRSPAPPGERIEPVQRQQRLRRNVGHEIEPAMVRKLVRNRHVAGGNVVMRHELWRQGNHLVHYAESDGPGNGGRFHQSHLSGIAHRHAAGQQIAPHGHVFTDPPAQEDHRAADPQREQQIGHHDAHFGRQGGGRHGCTVRGRIGNDHHQRLARGRRGGTGFRRHPGGQHDGRHHEPQERQRPQGIGDLRPAPA